MTLRQMGTTRHGSGEESEEESKILAKNVTNLMPLKPASTVLSPLCSWKAKSKFNEDIGERRYIVVK